MDTVSPTGHLNLITRWIWSPLEKHNDGQWLPVAFEYSMEGSHAPLFFDCGPAGGWALVKCRMLREHMEAAGQDHRLTILDLHSKDPIPQEIAIHLGPEFNISLYDTPRQMLDKLGAFHSHFHPDS